MKTKNILKAMAVAMLMPAMMLTTACSSDDDLANSTPENIIKKGYEVPVTVSVTRQGDADATGNRASFNESTHKLEFTTDDKLFVRGSQTTAGNFAGTLDYVSDGKFSGTITTENEYTGSINALLAGAVATLLPKGYESYAFITVPGSGYDANFTINTANAFATTKAAAVEQLSLEYAEYSSGFDLAPLNAILNFTITGLAVSTQVAVVFKFPDSGMTITISKNVTTDGSGKATFAIGVYKETDLKDCSLTVGGNAITLVSESKTLEARKIYNITRSALTYPIALSAVTSNYMGSVIGQDGKVYKDVDAAIAASTNAVAKICYVGSENGESAPYNHGLAMDLNNWGSDSWSGAVTSCPNYNNTNEPVTGASWKLPSKDQWEIMISAAGGYAALRDGLNMDKTYYWSSTENSSSDAWIYDFHDSRISPWLYWSKVDTNIKARACLTF